MNIPRKTRIIWSFMGSSAGVPWFWPTAVLELLVGRKSNHWSGPPTLWSISGDLGSHVCMKKNANSQFKFYWPKWCRSHQESKSQSTCNLLTRVSRSLSCRNRNKIETFEHVTFEVTENGHQECELSESWSLAASLAAISHEPRLTSTSCRRGAYHGAPRSPSRSHT